MANAAFELNKTLCNSEVDAAQSNRALACVTLSSEAITLTLQVINSTSLLSLENAVYEALLESLLSSGLVSASLCNSARCCLRHFLHMGGARHLLAICPGFKQFLHQAFFITRSIVPHVLHFGISHNCLVDGYLSRMPRMLPQPPCRTCTRPSVIFARAEQTQNVELVSPRIATDPHTGVSSWNRYYVPSTSAWWFRLTLPPL